MTTEVRDRITEALIELENQHGQVTPDLVVEAATDPQSPLHQCFQWSDEIAGHAYRLDQARALIRSVRVDITTTKGTIHTVSYVRDVRADRNETGYVRLEKVSEEGLAEATVKSEVDRAVALIVRGRGVAAALGREAEFVSGVRAALK